ncbi:MAG: hypothetical protein N3G22_04105 [Candidatus Micrarchaeota archaeon]|nr:hypothetical protein [Candidatus Micrarchaeota archaeon]
MENPPQEQPQDIREITIQLDSYDDIFSDFDPRPYSSRELSEDFLKEIRRRYLEDKRGRFEVRFTIPSAERDLREETLIRKRLREHFALMVAQENEVIASIRRRGYIYISAGAAVLLANVFALFLLEESSLLYQILSIFMVPAGWYGMFTGIGKVLDEPYEAIERKKVYEKFEKANYIFIGEERE